MKEVN